MSSSYLGLLRHHFQTVAHPQQVREVRQYTQGAFLQQSTGLGVGGEAKKTNAQRLRGPHVPNAVTDVNNVFESVQAVLLPGSPDDRPQDLRPVHCIIILCPRESV